MRLNEDFTEVKSFLSHLLSEEEMAVLHGLFSPPPLTSFDELVDVVSPRLGYTGPGAWISVLRSEDATRRQGSPDDK